MSESGNCILFIYLMAWFLYHQNLISPLRLTLWHIFYLVSMLPEPGGNITLNSTDVIVGSKEHQALWKSRLTVVSIVSHNP